MKKLVKNDLSLNKKKATQLCILIKAPKVFDIFSVITRAAILEIIAFQKRTKMCNEVT